MFISLKLRNFASLQNVKCREIVRYFRLISCFAKYNNSTFVATLSIVPKARDRKWQIQYIYREFPNWVKSFSEPGKYSLVYTVKFPSILDLQFASLDIWHFMLLIIFQRKYDVGIKGTVSQELRWVLQYIKRKLFSWANVAHHEILILLKRHLKIYERRSSGCTAQQFQVVWMLLDVANIVHWHNPYQEASLYPIMV